METITRIKQLKQERNALIMAHNYVEAPLQEVADFVGDSLELSRKAANLSAPVIVLVGVHFMAETCKIMSPASRVFVPAPDAGCPMADMAPAQDVAAYRQAHPGTVLVAYVNTTAATKAEVDICCTSSNAEQIVASIPADREIMFLPDRNLGANIAAKLGRKMNLWPGCCPVHDKITAAQVAALRQDHPGAVLMMHPECRPEVIAHADLALSTGKMLSAAKEVQQDILVGTETGIIHRLKVENPGKAFFPLQPEPICPDMKKNTLEKLLSCLENLSGEVLLSDDICRRARLPIERMLAGHL